LEKIKNKKDGGVKILHFLQIPIYVPSRNLTNFELDFIVFSKRYNKLICNPNSSAKKNYVDNKKKWGLIIYILERDYDEFIKLIKKYPNINCPKLDN